MVYYFLEKILYCCLLCLLFVSTGLSQNLKKGKNEVFIATGDGLDGYEDILAKKPVTPRNISAKLYLPSTCNKKKFPAVIIQHGLGGPTTPWFSRLAQNLNNNGFIAIVPDSLSSRGIGFRRSMLLSRANRLYDVFATFRFLQKLPCVEKSRIGITGYSFGGSIALDVAESVLAKQLGNGYAFKASLPVYPLCNAHFLKTRSTNTAVHILAGELDDWTPATQCRQVVKKKKAGNWNIKISVFKGAHHGFTHDFPPTKKMDRWHFKECGFNTINERGVETNKKFGMSTEMGWRKMVMTGLRSCARKGVTIGGSPELVNRTLNFTVRFFNQNLKKISILKATFNSLTKDQRKAVQAELLEGGYYNSTVDGLYGKNTEKGLKDYWNANQSSLNLENSVDIKKLFENILTD
tara:strand:- start:91 stop:1311 length:1221 start_codon:yes stop_codon:yes gene_type:complete